MGIKNSQKVLVTGGAGYLGARVGSSLAAQGYDVSLGSRSSFPHRVVEGCDQVVTNWEDSELKFCKGFDVIIHAAGMNARECDQSPNLAIQFNGEMTERLALKSATYGCKRFIYLSTVHVYQSPLLGVFSEESTTLNTHPYAMSHLYGEEALIRVAKGSAMTGHVLRLSNCFGYPLSKKADCWELVLNEFVRDAFSLGKITIKGDYFARRDFLPISELSRILVDILASTVPIPEIINVSTGNSRTLLEAAIQVGDVVLEMTGKSVEICKNDLPILDSSLKIKNNALDKVGIYPSKDLTQEIRLMLEYLKVGT